MPPIFSAIVHRCRSATFDRLDRDRMSITHVTKTGYESFLESPTAQEIGEQAHKYCANAHRDFGASQEELIRLAKLIESMDRAHTPAFLGDDVANDVDSASSGPARDRAPGLAARKNRA